MSLEEKVFAKKKVIFDKLKPAGFVLSDGLYHYEELILDGDFQVRVQINSDGELHSQVFDMDLEEEYTAIHISRATGGFVGQVREAYLAVLERLGETCFEALPFAKDQTNRLARKIASEWGLQSEIFDKFSKFSVYRHEGNQKWFALMTLLPYEKLDSERKRVPGSRRSEAVEIMNLKIEAEDMPKLLKYEGIYPSYHMSKKSWISVVLDGSLPDDLVWDLISKSRYLVQPKGLRNAFGPDFWVIPANPKVFDIDAEFAEKKVVYWTQKGKIKKGDLVAMYVTAPVQAIRYVCRCLEAEMDNDIYPEDPETKKLMKVELIATFEDGLFPFAVMKELGVHAVRGPRRMTKELIEAVEKAMKVAEN